MLNQYYILEIKKNLSFSKIPLHSRTQKAQFTKAFPSNYALQNHVFFIKNKYSYITRYIDSVVY